MSDLASLLGIRNDASVGRGGRIEILIGNPDYQIDPVQLEQARQDFLAVRLRGQLPHEIAPDVMARQSSAAVSDAQAVCAGFEPEGRDLEPFITADEINANAGEHETAAGTFSPLTRASIRLAHDYSIVCRKHRKRSIPTSHQAYLEAHAQLKEELALTGLEHDVLDVITSNDMEKTWPVCWMMITDLTNTRADDIRDLTDFIAREHYLNLALIDDADAVMQDILTCNGPEIRDHLETNGIPLDAVINLAKALFAIRAVTLNCGDEASVQILYSAYDAALAATHGTRSTSSVDLAIPAEILPHRSTKVQRDGVTRVSQGNLLYAYMIEILAAGLGGAGVNLLLSNMMPTLETAKSQLLALHKADPTLLTDASKAYQVSSVIIRELIEADVD